jgi:hypothetical protein
MEGAHDVGLDELTRPMDGAVHMALGGKVDDRARPVLGQQTRHQRRITDVALHEHMARVALQTRQGFQVASVGEFVEVDDGLIRGLEPVQYKVAADDK